MSIKPNKALGQNFLTNFKVINQMVDTLMLQQDDHVVELGGGMGAITKELIKGLDNTNTLEVVELDDRFIAVLKEITCLNENVKVKKADILDFLSKFSSHTSSKIIGAIPYYITSPIIHGIIRMEQLPTIAVLLIQKEVAEKISQKVPEASYLSTITQTFYNAELVANVDKNAFTPSPKVDSAILKLSVKNEFKLERDSLRKYEGFLHKAYSNPRKMLNKVFTNEELTKSNLDGSLRPQNISPEEWIKVFKSLTI